MGTYLIRRGLQSAATLVAVFVIVFFMLHLLGDPVAMMLELDYTDEEYEAIKRKYGYDRPLPAQFIDYAGDVLHGDFGLSIRRRVPAIDLITNRIPRTAHLASVAFLISLVGIPFGILAATRPRSIVDKLINTSTFALIAAPGFWLALMMILLFAVELRLVPTSGYGGWTGWKYVVLPAIALSLNSAARFIQITRAAMLEELAKQYVMVARAKGLPQRVVLWVHTLKNAGISVVTLGGDELAHMLNGAVIIETIFAWPGLGQLTIEAIRTRDLPVVMAVLLLVTVMVMVVNLAVDLVYAFLDPRIRYG